jgi:AcrR family transcriptional regulator
MEERPRSREEAKRETREALLLAGIAEFSERGLAEPSLDAICSRAGYTRRAFYVHFRVRDDFISAVMEQVLGDFLDDRVLEASARSPEVRERFNALLRGAIDRVAKAAGEGQVSGTVRTDVESELVGALLVALALGSVNALEIGLSFDPGLVREAVISLLRPQED